MSDELPFYAVGESGPVKLEGFKLVAEAPDPCVAMVIHKDRLFVATTQRVYELIDGILYPMMFAVEPDEK